MPSSLPPASEAILRKDSTTRYRDNADDILPFTVIVSAENKDDQMKDISKKMCSFLRKYDHSQLSVKPLLGGLSNELFVVSASSTTTTSSTSSEEESQIQNSVLVRIHPSSSSQNAEHSIVDRNVENSVCAWLSSQQVGPIYYGRFRNGRVEEFYPNHVPLCVKDMGVVGPSQIAPIMAHFHSLQVPADVLASLPASTTNNSSYRGDIFYRVQSWLNMAETQTNAGKTRERAVQLLSTLNTDWEWLVDALHPSSSLKGTAEESSAATTVSNQFFRQIVFTHMDMQSLNFLRDDTNTDLSNPDACPIKVIDFEYAGLNPRALDMANTFCEHCDMNNMKADFDKEYPSDAIQNAFVQNYVRRTLELQASTSSQQQPPLLTTSPLVLESLVDDPVFLAAAQQMIGQYALVSHLSWAVWSIVQSNMSDVDFDYVEYAQHRMDGFAYMKQRFF